MRLSDRRRIRGLVTGRNRSFRMEGGTPEEAFSHRPNCTLAEPSRRPADQPRMGVPRGPDFGTREGKQLNPSCPTLPQCSVPHPCAFFLAQGWESTILLRAISEFAAATMLRAPSLRLFPGARVGEHDTPASDQRVRRGQPHAPCPHQLAPFSWRKGGRARYSCERSASSPRPQCSVPHPCAFFLAQGWESTILLRAISEFAAATMLRAPSLRLFPGARVGEHDTPASDQRVRRGHNARVPHPCAFFLAQGWESTILLRAISEFAAATMLRAPSLRLFPGARVGEHDTPASDQRVRRGHNAPCPILAPFSWRKGGRARYSCERLASSPRPQCSVPHPCAFFLAQGWESTILLRAISELAAATMLRAPSLRLFPGARVGEHDTPASD